MAKTIAQGLSNTRPGRVRACGWPWIAPLGLALLGGCAGVVRVQPLATANPMVAAYQLWGPGLDAVGQEARRLCPAGQQVLRQSLAGSRQVPVEGGWQRALHRSVAWIDSPTTQAEMMVVCLAAPTMAPAPPAAGQAVGASPGVAANPIGKADTEGGSPAAAWVASAAAAGSTPKTAPAAKGTKPVVTRSARPPQPPQPVVDELDLAAERAQTK